MGANSAIEWTDHTFNPWVGCAKVSPACDHCYAEEWAKRWGQSSLWRGERRRTSATNWKSPVKWNEWAKRDNVRRRVFSASLADWLDNQVPDEWRSDLLSLIDATPNLDWLLLTKRPQNLAKLVTRKLPDNVWLGITAEDTEHFWQRWPYIRQAPVRVRFVSYEPALGPLDPVDDCGADWIICGGESGPGKRPMNLRWAYDVARYCRTSGTKFFMKQVDKVQPIPADLLIREFPV